MDAPVPVTSLSPVGELPPLAPRNGNAFMRLVGRTVLRAGGWRVVGAFANVPKLVIIAAPHSSGWDAFWGLAAKLAMGVNVRFMAKAELFWWPLGPLLRALGGTPIERSASSGVVPQTVEHLRTQDTLWVVLAPEGTRKRVEKWKSGFWHIAVGAGAPVQCVFFHYPERTIGLGETFTMTGDLATDMATVRAYYRPFVGKHRDSL